MFVEQKGLFQGKSCATFLTHLKGGKYVSLCRFESLALLFPCPNLQSYPILLTGSVNRLNSVTRSVHRAPKSHFEAVYNTRQTKVLTE
jgi:hypothetical protein